MMTTRQQTARRHSDNFTSVCARVNEDADADILSGCEVGDFGLGVRKGGINVNDALPD